MPNWNSNNLTVKGLTDEQTKELASVIEADELLTHYLPIPEGMTYSLRGDEEEAKVNEDLYGAKDGYNWCLNNWGVKWDTDGAECSTFDGGLSAGFLTAWSPPIAGIRSISEQFPDATFTLTYWEEGCDFLGAVVCKNGAIDEGVDQSVSAVGSAWMAEHHPDLEEDSDEWHEVWWDNAYDVLLEVTKGIAADLGGQLESPQTFLDRHNREREAMNELLKSYVHNK